MAMTRTQQQDDACPECNSGLITKQGETYCRSCGIVTEENMLDHQPQYHAYGDDKTTSGRGQTTNAAHDKGLGSMMSIPDRDARGNPISGQQRTRLKRQREHQHNWQFDKKSLNNRHGMGEVLRLVSALDLSRGLSEQAGRLFRKAHNNGLAKGRSLDAIAAVCVFIVSRQNGNIREMGEWMDHVRVSPQAFRGALGKVQEELEVGYVPTTPLDYSASIMDEFELSNDVRQRVRERLKLIEEQDVCVGRKPQGVVAAVLYMESGLTQAEISGRVSASAVTIRSNVECIRNGVELK